MYMSSHLIYYGTTIHGNPFMVNAAYRIEAVIQGNILNLYDLNFTHNFLLEQYINAVFENLYNVVRGFTPCRIHLLNVEYGKLNFSINRPS